MIDGHRSKGPGPGPSRARTAGILCLAVVAILTTMSLLLEQIPLAVIKARRSSFKEARLEKPSHPESMRSSTQFSSPTVMLHSGIRNDPDQLARILLCRPPIFSSVVQQSNTTRSSITISNITHWTTSDCGEEDVLEHVHSVSTLRENHSDWVACAQKVDPTRLVWDPDNTDPLPLACPHYERKNETEKLATWILLTNDIRYFDVNLFHVMVMQDQKQEWGGLAVWCVLDAATKLALQLQSSDRRLNDPVYWRLEYRVDDDNSSNYIRELFRLLGHLPPTDERNSTKEVPLQLTSDTASWLLRASAQGQQYGSLSDSMHFRPNTEPNQDLTDISRRVRDVAFKNHNTGIDTSRDGEYVLVELRSGDMRRLAGSQTGTASEIILALLRRNLPVRIMDLAHATVGDQMEWFAKATVVIGMHGAGLTNLVWMEPDSTVFEVAASYGWARFVAENGTCGRKADEPVEYKKADYYNLARRFSIRHELVHPVYATRPTTFPEENPVSKHVYYVDADKLADNVERAFFGHSSRSRIRW